MMAAKTALALGLALTVFLSGCAIQPRPLEPGARAALAEADLERLFTDQAPVTGPIDLPEAMARAIKYNLDQRLKLMEAALARGQLAAMRYDLLPELTAEAGYHWRDNEAGASSISLLSGTESLEPSTSQERNRRTASAVMAWNVLDFGVSYASAQQQADEILIAEQRRRKVVQNILQDVRAAYWRAVSADRLMPLMDEILDKARAALDRVENLQALGLTPPEQALEYRKALLEITRQMWVLRQELATAKTELATLMNLRPGQPYELAVADPGAEAVARALEADIDALEQAALLHRPELAEEHYQARIGAAEVRKALLRLLPGLELNVGPYYDSNKYLYNSSWVEASAVVSWNLLDVFAGPARIEAARAQTRVDDTRRLALNMAVLTQVRLAYLRLRLAERDHGIARELLEVEEQLQRFAESEQQAEKANDLEVVRAMAQALVARMRHHRSYAELQNALGRLQGSVGFDPLPATLPADDLTTLAEALRQSPEDWLARLEPGPVPGE